MVSDIARFKDGETDYLPNYTEIFLQHGFRYSTVLDIARFNKRTKMALYRLPDLQIIFGKLVFRFKRISSIQIFKMAAILDFHQNDFSNF